MGDAKQIILKPIDSKTAHAFVRRVHYSRKSVNNSQLHIGVFWLGKLEGVMQFGPPMDKRRVGGLVRDSLWHEYIELNRLAFSDVLPKNSESRALSIAMKLLRKHAPQLKWVISFADATQCGDGTIYRASGFVLTGIKKNDQIWVMPDGEISSSQPATDTRGSKRGEILSRLTVTKGAHIRETGAASMKPFIEAGARPLDGYQLRYVYFIDPEYRKRLTVPEIPYSRIAEIGAGMYRGEKR